MSAIYEHPVYCVIPDSTIETLLAYQDAGRPTGDFTRACLENDLMGAFGRADHLNKPAIGAIVSFMYNELDSRLLGLAREGRSVARDARPEAARDGGEVSANPRPWKTVDPMHAPEEPDGWVILDANGDQVALLSHGNYQSDKEAAELIVRLVNEAQTGEDHV